MPFASNGNRRISFQPYSSRASSLADACESRSFASRLDIIAALVRRITIAQDQVTIEIKHEGLDRPPSGSEGIFTETEGSCADFDRGAGEVSAARRRGQARYSKSAAGRF